MTKHITLIGTDSSHCLAFAKLLKENNSPWQITGAIRDDRSNLPISTSRRKKIEANMVDNYDIKIHEMFRPEEASLTDAFIISAVDANLHLSQFKKIVQYGKPVFIDKPITYSLDETKEIYRLAEFYQTSVFSSSSLRFSESVVACSQTILNEPNAKWNVKMSGPITFQPRIPGLYWYGIHLLEALLTIFPESFEIDSSSIILHSDKVIINLNNARCNCQIIGSLNSEGSFKGKLVSRNQYVLFDSNQDEKPLYYYLLEKVTTFFDTRKSPIKPEITLRVIELIDKLNKLLSSATINESGEKFGRK